MAVPLQFGDQVALARDPNLGLCDALVRLPESVAHASYTFGPAPCKAAVVRPIRV